VSTANVHNHRAVFLRPRGLGNMFTRCISMISCRCFFRGGIGEWAVRGPMFFFEVGEVKGRRMRIEVG
jgi:hypothetical protein